MKNNILISLVTVSVAFFTACNQAENEIILPVEPEITETENPFAVTIDEAEQTLMEILAKEQQQTTRSDGTTHERRIKSRYTTGGNRTVTRSADGEEIVEEHPVVHIFNFENNEGFAVMGGDKRGAPMLALTGKGHLIPGMRTDNFGFIVSLARAEEVYRQQIIRSRIDTITNGYITVYNYINEIVVNENGQCPVRWGQWYPYNYYCPTGCPTGCVATAVAQLMAIYEYPTSYNGYTFDWDAMIADSTNTDIARLMEQLGKAGNLNMNYSPEGSGSYNIYVPQTLLNFGYSSGGLYCEDYDTDIIMQFVMAGSPVIIGGACTDLKYVYNNLGGLIYFDAYSKSAHSWLGDGGELVTVTSYIYNNWDGTWTTAGPITGQYVHCNFGWEGVDDGFYLSGFFNPQTQASTPYYNHTESGYTHVYYHDYNFQYQQDMVVGIQL